MKSTPESKLRCCSHCRRTLPIEEFYLINKHAGKRDAYCKSCRRLLNHLRQHPGAEPPRPAHLPRRRTLICEEPDPERRMQLILQARSKVHESVLRKQMRMREEEKE